MADYALNPDYFPWTEMVKQMAAQDNILPDEFIRNIARKSLAKEHGAFKQELHSAYQDMLSDCQPHERAGLEAEHDKLLDHASYAFELEIRQDAAISIRRFLDEVVRPKPDSKYTQARAVFAQEHEQQLENQAKQHDTDIIFLNKPENMQMLATLLPGTATQLKEGIRDLHKQETGDLHDRQEWEVLEHCQNLTLEQSAPEPEPTLYARGNITMKEYERLPEPVIEALTKTTYALDDLAQEGTGLGGWHEETRTQAREVLNEIQDAQRDMKDRLVKEPQHPAPLADALDRAKDALADALIAANENEVAQSFIVKSTAELQNLSNATRALSDEQREAATNQPQRFYRDPEQKVEKEEPQRLKRPGQDGPQR